MNVNKLNYSNSNMVFAGKRNISANFFKQKTKFSQFVDSIFCRKKTNDVQMLIRQYSFHRVSNVKELEKGFGSLFNAILNDKRIKKAPMCSVIQSLYNQYGFQGLLHQLWKPNPGFSIKPIIEHTIDKPAIVLAATKDDKPVFTLKNDGPYGLWNTLRDNYNAKRCMCLSFSHPDVKDSKINFYKDKSGNITYLNANEAIRYYKTTGTIKTETITLGGIEIIHYNKDGSKAFFKNLFFGGTLGADDILI